MTTIKEAALLIEDFSALGQISLVSALSILQSMDFTTAALPTAILSTQTECFGTPQRLATNEWVQSTTNHWQLIPDLDFNGALIGYLGQPDLVASVQKILANKLGNRPVIVDPVMGDEGKLYPGLNKEYIKAIQKLCESATVITPNWTELCLLTGESPQLPATNQNLKQLMNLLQQRQINAKVIITGVIHHSAIGCVFQSREEGFEFVGNPQVQGHFYGTGDTFAALILGFLLKDHSLTTAVKLATRMLKVAITETAQEEPVANRKYGLRLGNLIRQLVNLKQKGEIL
ncbi:PfkB family carbohydrate kinase [uncultured Limosilactobacillus sp.]|uniref:PfkB family carbohydrate kinase n=1 Tax=uncultured Limosilactobacillus sp. TaxID=2837629 RepID=UPI0025FE290A|nr:PfkB family carbohydrate kinase [uncultured Limosilactobacillus sp.]